MEENVAVKKEFQTGLAKVQDLYMKQVNSAMEKASLKLSATQTQNVMTCIQAMKTALAKSKLDFNDVDQSSVMDCLEKVALFNLNCASIPSECYIVIRGTVMQIGIQGAGYESLVSKYGRNVKRLYQPWLVREKDEFKYPHYKGIEIEPPEWTPTGKGIVVRVVYPVIMKDDSVQYLIAERADVVRNLIAHIANNLMHSPNKDAVLKKCEGKTLEQILGDKELCLAGNVSPAWQNQQSSEQMITTKMKNNVLRGFPKEFDNTFIEEKYEATNDDDAETNAVVEEKPALELDADQKAKEDVDTKTGEVVETPPSDFGNDDKKEKTDVPKEEAKEATAPASDDFPF